MDAGTLKTRLDALVIFRDLLRDPAVAALSAALGGGTAEAAAFEALLFERGDDWSRCLEALVLDSDNVCIRRGEAKSPVLRESMERELAFLQQLAMIQLADLPGGVDFLVPWKTSAVDIPAAFRRRVAEVGTRGYGMFARHHVFTLEDGKLVPVRHPDPQTLEELPGYERERSRIVANTEALLEGRGANNVLLYGDAGTGKSSTVKALANAYAHRGLRLVEVRKDQLFQLPELMDALAENPLKFIVFIDDLSFAAGDDNFAALKAVLEGSVGVKAANAAVYATSNRRHLVKETLADREGDDIHASDTRQELMSLSARFALIVTFEHPDKERYLGIVRELARNAGLDREEEALLTGAEGYAIRAGGRSARAAKQYVELCKARVL